jgi:hypothetical protein
MAAVSSSSSGMMTKAQLVSGPQCLSWVGAAPLLLLSLQVQQQQQQ